MLADAHGNVIHLGERDCTIQRRHQKLVEETPSPAVDDELRERIGAIAVDAARAVGYRSAGTIEGLLDARRLLLLPRDEHAHPGRAHRHRAGHRHRPRPRAGLDRAGRAAIAPPGGRRLRGHAIECRINAEDVASGLPARAGADHALPRAGGPGRARRLGRRRGSEISALYDPMIAKLIVHGVDREHARRGCCARSRSSRSTASTTLLGFHRALLEHPCFVAGETCHGVVESEELAPSRGAQLSHRTTSRRRAGRRAARRPRDERRGRRPALRRDRARARAAVGRARARARPNGAARRRGAADAPRSSARCRARCSPSRSRRATRSRPGRCSASSRR